MRGQETLWLPGMDHAGIATQNVVEREIAKDGLSRHDLGREAFVERVWQWKEESGGRILGQMKKLGDGVDWSRERFTMDPGLSRAVQTIFKKLFDDGLIYRAERIINWCPRCLPRCRTSRWSTDDEGELVSIRYGDGDDSIVVATTRAETMLGDTAVAVHPSTSATHTWSVAAVDAPAHRTPHPGRRRRARRPGLRHRSGQGHPGARPERLRDRPPPLAAVHDGHGRARCDHRSRALRRARPLRGQARGGGRAPRGGPDRRGEATLHPLGRPLLAMQDRRRAAALAPVVRQRLTPRQGRGRRGPRGPDTIHPPELAKRYFDWVDDMHDWCISRQLWWGHRDPRLVRPRGRGRLRGSRRVRRPRDTSRTRTSSTPGSPPAYGRSRLSAGRTGRRSSPSSIRPPFW